MAGGRTKRYIKKKDVVEIKVRVCVRGFWVFLLGGLLINIIIIIVTVVVSENGDVTIECVSTHTHHLAHIPMYSSTQHVRTGAHIPT